MTGGTTRVQQPFRRNGGGGAAAEEVTKRSFSQRTLSSAESSSSGEGGGGAPAPTSSNTSNPTPLDRQDTGLASFLSSNKSNQRRKSQRSSSNNNNNAEYDNNPNGSSGTDPTKKLLYPPRRRRSSTTTASLTAAAISLSDNYSVSPSTTSSASSSSSSSSYTDDSFSTVSSLSGTYLSEQSHELCVLQTTTIVVAKPASGNGEDGEVQQKHEEQKERKLFGRDKELQSLRDAYQSVRRTGRPLLYLVEGSSGAGKSALIEVGLRNPVSRQNGYFGSGKFYPNHNHTMHNNSDSSDNQNHQSSYSAIVAAFTDVCDLVVQQTKHQHDATRQRVLQAFRPEELSILQSLIGNLSTLLDEKEGESETKPQQSLNEEEPSLSSFIQTNRSSAASSSSSSSSSKRKKKTNAAAAAKNKMMMMNDAKSVASTSTSSSAFAFRRFQLLCRKLLRVLATPEHPIVLFLDDLHNADKASLEVLQSILQRDTAPPYVMLVCSYRKEEQRTKPHLHNFLLQCCNSVVQQQQQQQASNNDNKNNVDDASCQSVSLVQTRFLSIEDLSVSEVNQMIKYMTRGQAAEETPPLAQLVWKKTHGNPFFLHQFLHHLWRTRMMQYKQQDKQWHWDLKLIQAETNVSENVVQLVASKVRKLHPLVQKTLQLAACLGSFFDATTLQSVVMADFKKKKKKPPTMVQEVDSNFLQILLVAVREGLIENGDRPNRYKFTHDRVQQCLYNMIHQDQRSTIHLQIGNTVRSQLLLWQRGSDESHKDFMLFLATDQLNAAARGLVKDPQERRELVQLNMTAGGRAMSKSAFFSAAEYLRRAIQLLDKATMWRDAAEYELTLEVFTTSAVYESCSGNFEECQQRSSEVLLHARCIEDKMGAYKILMDSLGTQGQFLDATQLGLSVLGELGEKFPNKPPTNMQVQVELIRAKSCARNKTDKDFMTLPLMTDKKKLATCSVLVSVSTFAFFLEASNLLKLATSKMMRITVQYGQSNLTPICYACWAMLQSQLGNGAEAYRFGRLSLSLLEQSKAYDAEAMAQGIVYSFANHWQRPLRESIVPLQKAYISGLKYGNIEHGVLSGFNSIGASMTTGRPLAIIEAEMREIYNRMVDYGQDATVLTSVPVWQTILNLMGRNEDPLVLTGDAMDEDEVWKDAIESQNAMALHFMDFSKLKVACMFQAWAVAEDALTRMEEHKTIAKGAKAHFSIVECTFYEGLTNIVLAQKTGKRSQLKLGKQAMQRLECWHSDGKTDALPFLLCLEAELEVATNGEDLTEVVDAYTHAIAAAEACQFVNMQAFSNERAGTLLAERNDFVRGREFLLKAKKLYQKWGALAKVVQLEQRVAVLKNKV